MSGSVYGRALGERLAMLPPAVRMLHDVRAPTVWRGRCSVRRGRGAAAMLLGAAMGLPRPGEDMPIAVTFAPDGEGETWTRDFAGRLFVSRQWAVGARIRERVGLVHLTFDLKTGPEALELVLAGVHVLGLPLPRPLWPCVRTRETAEGPAPDRGYVFDVEAGLPGIGLLVHYRGSLARVSGEGEAAREATPRRP